MEKFIIFLTYMKKFLSHFFVGIGVIASIITIISFFFDFQWNQMPDKLWIVICAIVVICICYAVIRIWRKKKILLRISENFKLTVEEGDLLQKKGIIVIPVNNYFDTHLGDGIINPKSIHGQFISQLFEGRIGVLDNLINISLSDQNVISTGSVTRKNGKSNRYPLGTCADVLDGGNCYVLVVTTEFDNDNVAQLPCNKLSVVVDGLFNHLKIIAENKPIYMPVIGSGLSRLNRRLERILFYLIDYYDFSLSDKRLLGGVHIVILSKKDVDLNRIENTFNEISRHN